MIQNAIWTLVRAALIDGSDQAIQAAANTIAGWFGVEATAIVGLLVRARDILVSIGDSWFREALAGTVATAVVSCIDGDNPDCCGSAPMYDDDGCPDELTQVCNELSQTLNAA